MKISINWIRDFVDLPPPLERIAERLTMAGLEVKKLEPTPDRKDVLFEIEVTTNRSDWLSHWGVAREIAAVENLSLRNPAVDSQPNRPLPSGWKIHLKEPEGCPYYSAVYFEGVTQEVTPDFIKDRLAACGLRSVGLLVDITNYVLMETGQPLHVFDADLLRGHEIQVRRAKTGERITAIDGAVLTLDASDLLIADAERGVALGGVMGGKESEVSERTRNILLESAFFHPRWIRQSSRRHGLASESSYRFERRVDPEGVDHARARAVHLIQQYARPRFVSGVLKAGQKPVAARPRLHLSSAEVEKILGLKIKSHQIASFLTRLGFEVKQDSAESLNVSIPSFRSDVTRSVDLVEEVARLYGYDKIPETLPAREPLLPLPNNQLETEARARQFFSGCGFCEAVTFSLVSETGFSSTELKDVVRVPNPQNQELCLMRPTLLTSLLPVVGRNIHWGEKTVSLFEIANIYHKAERAAHPKEERVLGLVLWGKFRRKNWSDSERDFTFYHLKGVLEAFLNDEGISPFAFRTHQIPFLTAHGAQRLEIGGQVSGILGQVDPRLAALWEIEEDVFFAEIFLEKLSAHQGPKRFRGSPRYPAIERDMALIVPETVKAGEIEEHIRALGQGLMVGVELFDLFRGGRVPSGFKNLAFRVTYQSREFTLVSEEIQKLHASVAEKIAQKFQASFQ